MACSGLIHFIHSHVACSGLIHFIHSHVACSGLIHNIHSYAATLSFDTRTCSFSPTSLSLSLSRSLSRLSHSVSVSLTLSLSHSFSQSHPPPLFCLYCSGISVLILMVFSHLSLPLLPCLPLSLPLTTSLHLLI